MGIAVAAVLPVLNRRFRIATVWCTSELVFHALMVATYFCDSEVGLRNRPPSTFGEDADLGVAAGIGGLMTTIATPGRAAGANIVHVHVPAAVAGLDGTTWPWGVVSGPLLIAVLTGANYAVHNTNPLLLAAAMAENPNNRGATIAMVNNALPAGQLVIAALGGTVAQHWGGFRAVFVLVGGVGFVMTAALWALAERERLFTPRVRGY